MSQELLNQTRDRMDRAVKALEEDLTGIRTGRASPHLLERLQVEYYGTMTPLNQMATIAAPELRLLTIRPWDPTAMGKIEKAILASDLGLTPSNDGQTIRLPIPALTEERREELIKFAAKRCEEARVEVRNLRRDALHHLDQEDLPEDVLYGARDDIQELTDKHVKMVDELSEKKAAEIREN